MGIGVPGEWRPVPGSVSVLLQRFYQPYRLVWGGGSVVVKGGTPTSLPEFGTPFCRPTSQGSFGSTGWSGYRDLLVEWSVRPQSS